MCIHKEKRRIKDCNLCDNCEHNKIKRFCSQCPNNWCIHKNHKYRCKKCKKNSLKIKISRPNKKEIERMYIEKKFNLLIEVSKYI